jgi:hypothetical protein
MQIDHSLRPEALGAEPFGGEGGCGCAAPDCDIEQLIGQLDERTISYVLETRPHFEDLRQALSQIAGMLVLATAGAKSVTQDHAMLAAAQEAHQRALDGIRAARPALRARHHHRHLLDAADCLGLAIAKAGESLHLAGDRRRTEGVFVPLRTAYRNLHWAAQALPGFEILNFDQACCAPQA